MVSTESVAAAMGGPFSVGELRLCLEIVDGILIWKIADGRRVKVGDVAGGCPKGHKYCRMRLHGRGMYVHRVVFAMVHGRWPTGDIDHINGIRTDNRPENLREATRSQNIFNKGLLGRNSSGKTGVSWAAHAKAWAVKMMVRGKTINLGYHKDYEFACFVREIAEDKYHGEFKWAGH